MNFKLGRFFYLMISFIIGGFFLISGLFSLILPWSSFLKKMTTEFIDKNSLIFFLFGLALILIGLSILIYTYLNTQRRYIYIKIGPRSIALDENVVYQYLESYWQQHFPKRHIPFNVKIQTNSIQIAADLPVMELSDQKTFLEQVKFDFTDLFGRVLNYPHDIDFIANFETKS